MIVERILQIIEYKGISKNKFYTETSLSNGFLDKVKDVGVSKVEIILSTYPDINPTWLLTGKGEMLKSSINTAVNIENANVNSSIGNMSGGSFTGGNMHVNESQTEYGKKTHALEKELLDTKKNLKDTEQALADTKIQLQKAMQRIIDLQDKLIDNL